jgi:ATPase
MKVRRDNRRPSNKIEKLDKILPDTSAIIHGKITSLAEQGKLKGSTVFLHELVMGEIQSQTARGLDIGFIGLEEVKNLRENSKKYGITVESYGEKASYDDIRLAKSGRIDSLIQDAAKKIDAVLITCDMPQALVADAEGIRVQYFDSYEKTKSTKLESFFTEDTMSVHLKTGCVPLAKRGKPGKFSLMRLGKKEMTSEEIDEIRKEILDGAKYEDDGFFEMSARGSTIIQLRNMRIAIAIPPFSEKTEITAVRPIVKLVLDDYKLSEKLKNRLDKKAEGILVAGPPGSGKSTFAASMAKFYLDKGKIVKTMESPRDLQVPKEVTQYAPLEKSFARTAEILLLVRPDYTIFDEVRKIRDFEVFSDMRLAGIGMIGVVHSSEAVEAVQRFIGKIDLGIIPSVLDTIIYIKDGHVEKVLSLSLTVKCPHGMKDDDLARPVVEVKDFETGKLEYEIYTYGEQTVVIPVGEESSKEESGLRRLAKQQIKRKLKEYHVRDVEFLSDNKIAVHVPNKMVARMIGKDGKNIKELEEKLGIKIDVEAEGGLNKEVEFSTKDTGAYIALTFGKKMCGKNANVQIEGEYLFTATVGREGQIKVAKRSDIGKQLIRAVTTHRDVKVFI